LVSQINNFKFDIEVNDKSRIYHFSDATLGSDKWLIAIQTLLNAQKEYLRSSLRK
jgi:hypothetical protein